MAELLPMLALSPTMEEGVLVKWSLEEGAAISSGDVVCEVETDKAVMEYEASVEGTLLKRLVEEGSAVKVGSPIAIIGEAGEDISDLEAQAAQQGEGAAPPKAPEQAEPAEEEPAEEEPAEEEAAKEEPAAPQAAPERTGPVKASPLARRLAEDAGLDLRSLQGSGPGGRVVKRDIEAAREAAPAAPPAEKGRLAAAAPQPQAAAAPAAGAPLRDQSVPIGQKRRIIAQRLAESKFSAPHYYLTIAAAMDELMAQRSALNAQRQAKGQPKVSLNAFLIKLSAMAIARHPAVNSTWEGETITTHGSVDVGLAVALDDGLITPVVRDCVSKGIVAIDEEMTGLIDRARSGGLKPEQFTGATFTISNLGTYGIESFTAIINPPGSAILAIGQIARTPVAGEGDEVRVASVMKVTLSCDHRVIDGAVGAAFLHDLRDMLETPMKALF